MAIPAEDRGPAWLQDWQHIEADIQAMDDFAKKLRADVETNYVSHLTPIYDDMTATLPGPTFPELGDLLSTHHEATQSATNLVHEYANRSAGMAQAASTISSNYRESDAFANATVTKVQSALNESGVTAPNTPQPGNRPGTPTGGHTIPDLPTTPTTEAY